MAVYREAMPLSVSPRRGQFVSPAENQWVARLWFLKAIEEWAPTVILELADTLTAGDPGRRCRRCARKEALAAVLAARCIAEPWMRRLIGEALQRWEAIPELLDRDEPEWPCYPAINVEWRDGSKPDTRTARKEKRLNEGLSDFLCERAGWRKNATIDRRWLRAAVEHKILGRTVEEIQADLAPDEESSTVDRGINGALKAAGLEKRRHKRGPQKRLNDD